MYRPCRWGALSYRGRLSLPSLLASPTPLPAPQSPSLSLRSRPWRPAECANAHPTRARSRKTPLPIRSRRCSRALCHAFPLRRASFAFPPSGARSPLRSCSPRHADNPRAPCGRFSDGRASRVVSLCARHCPSGCGNRYAASRHDDPCGDKI